MSYHCSRLKVPYLEVCRNLQAGEFSRAFTKCVLRSRRIPDVVRTDRCPEMVNRVNEEFMNLCNIRHSTGASLTPRHQGLGERGHQVVLINHGILMHEVCKAFPQEWPSLIPTVEYLYHTRPQGAHGLSAHDMTAG